MPNTGIPRPTILCSVATLPCFVLGRTYKACIPSSAACYVVAIARTMTITLINVPFLCIIFQEFASFTCTDFILEDACIIMFNRHT